MSTRESEQYSSEVVRKELDELRQHLLSAYAISVLAAVMSRLFYIAWRNQVVVSLDLAVLVATVCSSIAFALREKHYHAACWTLLLGLSSCTALTVLSMPSILTLALGATIVIVSHALLGSRRTIIVVAITWGACVLASNLAKSPDFETINVLGTLALTLLIWGASTISGRALVRSMELALRGWSQLRVALLDARERKAELYRVVRALEEATHRTQRMNNELLVARQRTEAVLADKRRFVATVSHELRGPLNLILGFGQLVALSPESYGVDLPSVYRADIDTIYENSRHLVSLLDDILDLSGMEIDQIPLVRQPIDLQHDVIDDAIKAVQLLATHRGIGLCVEPLSTPLTVMADRGRLRQVMLNLLTNSLRFTDHGTITVSTQLRDGNVRVTVSDTGRGIAPDQLPDLFKEFRQLHAGGDMTLQGTGLGLSISKRIVELHGGRIWAESTEGRGTSVHFAFPWRQEEESLAPGLVETRPIRTRGSQETCIVVHHDPLIVRQLARRIREYRVVGLGKPDNVAALADEWHPKAIITSDRLAQDVQERLCTQCLNVPVLSCALPSLDDRIEGSTTCLMKPINTDMLSTVMRYIDNVQEPTIMIVDDDLDAARLHETILKNVRPSCTVLKAYSGMDALSAMRRATPDIVLMDLLMPGMDGRETISKMREDSQLADIPVVIVSAHDLHGQTATLGRSLTLHLSRPINPSQGASYLNALLGVLRTSYLYGPEAHPPS